MGDNLAGVDGNVFLLAGITIAVCVFLHMIYKNVFSSKKKETLQSEAESDSGAPSEEASSESAVAGSRTGKSKKRATWKGKTEFSHPWLLKNLKGHPGTVLLVDFSANGKFMAATCDDAAPTVI